MYTKVKKVTTENISIKHWKMGGFKCKLESCGNSQESLRKPYHQSQNLTEKLLWLTVYPYAWLQLPSVGRMYFSGPVLGLPHVNGFLPMEYEQKVCKYDLCHIQAGALSTLQVLAWYGLVLASALYHEILSQAGAIPSASCQNKMMCGEELNLAS